MSRNGAEDGDHSRGATQLMEDDALLSLSPFLQSVQQMSPACPAVGQPAEQPRQLIMVWLCQHDLLHSYDASTISC